MVEAYLVWTSQTTQALHHQEYTSCFITQLTTEHKDAIHYGNVNYNCAPIESVKLFCNLKNWGQLVKFTPLYEMSIYGTAELSYRLDTVDAYAAVLRGFTSRFSFHRPLSRCWYLECCTHYSGNVEPIQACYSTIRSYDGLNLRGYNMSKT